MSTLRSNDSLGASQNVYHGGDLAAAQIAFPNAPQPWLDLSTGINPNPYPLPAIAPEAWRRLPGRERISELERIAAVRYNASEHSRVVAGPGIQGLIQILPRLRPAKNIGILGLTYLEYERVWRAVGAKVKVVETLDDLRSFDVAVVVNPNNPDGRLISADELIDIAVDFPRRGALLLIDEAFMDPLPIANSAARLPLESVIVLRSFGKMYGLAGVRLGFAITAPMIAREISDLLGPWSVSGPAIEVGVKALSDNGWLAAAIDDLNKRAAVVDATLIEHGFSIVGGTPLFRLAEHRNAFALFEALGRLGILVRYFPTKPNLLRFGLPGTEIAFDRFRTSLDQIRSKCDSL